MHFTTHQQSIRTISYQNKYNKEATSGLNIMLEPLYSGIIPSGRVETSGSFRNRVGSVEICT